MEAAELFRGAMRSGRDDLAAAARAELAEVEPQLGRLTVQVTGPRDDVELQIDGRPLSFDVVGAPMPADPGERLIEARRDGEVVAEARTTVTSGEASELEIEIPEPEAPPPSPDEVAERAAPDVLAPTPEPADDGGSDDAVIWAVVLSVIALAAGAGVGLGVYFGTQQSEPIDGNLIPGTLEFGN